MKRWLLSLILGPALAGCATLIPPATVDVVDASLPFALERLTLDGPLVAVVARVDLTDPRVRIHVALADPRDPDGPGPCTGQLDTVSNAARRENFALALNASFFSAPIAKQANGKPVRYVVGNCATPVGYHASGGRTLAQPSGDAMRAVFMMDAEGRPSIVENVRTVPANIREAVSGNVVVLRQGEVVQHAKDTARHPRSVVGYTADRRTLFLVAVDGRQTASRGATYAELGALMRKLGAADALNLDGGGSTALVVRDPLTGVHGVTNRPSDLFPAQPWLGMERPVADLIGVRIQSVK